MLADVPAAAGAPPEMAAPTIEPVLSKMDEEPLPTATPSRGAAETARPEISALREKVTERVAHELARDLSDKLLERIERIVWEVVPDLAEILISQEIDRIRAQAESKQSS